MRSVEEIRAEFEVTRDQFWLVRMRLADLMMELLRNTAKSTWPDATGVRYEVRYAEAPPFRYPTPVEVILAGGDVVAIDLDLEEGQLLHSALDSLCDLEPASPHFASDVIRVG